MSHCASLPRPGCVTASSTLPRLLGGRLTFCSLALPTLFTSLEISFYPCKFYVLSTLPLVSPARLFVPHAASLLHFLSHRLLLLPYPLLTSVFYSRLISNSSISLENVTIHFHSLIFSFSSLLKCYLESPFETSPVLLPLSLSPSRYFFSIIRVPAFHLIIASHPEPSSHTRSSFQYVQPSVAPSFIILWPFIPVPHEPHVSHILKITL